MKNFILCCLMLFSVSLFSQQTKLDIRQIETLPVNHFLTSDGTNNITLERSAGNIIVTPPAGYTSTDQDALNNEFAANITAVAAGAADGVATGGTLDEANDEIDIAVDAPGADFSIDITGLAKNSELLDNDDSNELQTLTTSGTTTGVITLSDGGGSTTFAASGASSISRSGNTITVSSTDNVNDADASTTNEIQTITDDPNTNQIDLDLGGGDVDRSDAMTEETFAPTSGNTITLSASPDATKDITVSLNGQELYFTAIGGGTPDLSLSGNTLTFNYWTFSSGDIARIKYPK